MREALRQARRADGWISAFAPATVANFGSGFDAFAAALAVVERDGAGRERRRPIGDRVSVLRTKRRGVRIVGIEGDGGRLPTSSSLNCAAVAAGAVLREWRAPFGLDLVLVKGLPLSSGLGSSAASAAAGAFAAAAAVGVGTYRGGTGTDRGGSRPPRRSDRAAAGPGRSARRRATRLRPVAASLRSRSGHRSAARLLGVRDETEKNSAATIDKSALLRPALAGEHVADGSWHGDNVWASLLGGGVIVVSTHKAEIVPIASPRSLRWVTVHPDLEVRTRDARRVLPRKVALADAASQAGCFAALVTAWQQGDREGIGRGLEDRLAEPYRAHLVRGYASARRAAIRAGAHGVTFAGAGPSILAVTPEGREEAVGEAMRRAFRGSGVAATAFVCAVDLRGARVEPA